MNCLNCNKKVFPSKQGDWNCIYGPDACGAKVNYIDKMNIKYRKQYRYEFNVLPYGTLLILKESKL